MISTTTLSSLSTDPVSFLLFRPGSTDDKVLLEIYGRRVYQKPSVGFVPQPSDRWLDLGANIGAFSQWALSKGSPVVAAYEPEPSNYALLIANHDPSIKCHQQAVTALPHHRAVQDLYLCKKPTNHYRHTLRPIRGRLTVPVPVTDIKSVLALHRSVNAIKMDIEGSEIEILELNLPWRDLGIQKLVFEYTFDADPSIPRFKAIIDQLLTQFHHVHFDKVDLSQLEYKFFPACTMVYCFD